MDFPEKGRLKVIIYILLMLFIARCWYAMVLVNVDELNEALGLAEEETLANGIMILKAITIIMNAWLVDSYFGIFPMILISFCCFVVWNIIFLSVRLTGFDSWLKLIGSGIKFTSALTYAAKVLLYPSYLSLVTDNVNIHIAVMVLIDPFADLLANVFSNDITMDTLLGYCLVVTPIFLSGIWFHNYFYKRPLVFQIIEKMFMSLKYIRLISIDKSGERDVNQEGKIKSKYNPSKLEKITMRFWKVCEVLVFIISRRYIQGVLELTWKSQSRKMSSHRGEGNLISVVVNAAKLVAIPFWVSFFFFMAKVTQFFNNIMHRFILAWIVMAVPLIFTAVVQYRLQNEMETLPGVGYGQMRIINAINKPFTFNSSSTGQHKLQPGQEYRVKTLLGHDYINKVFTITIPHHPAYELLIQSKEHESTTFLMTKLGIVRIFPHDPVLKGPHGTNKWGIARIQILSNGCEGQILIDSKWISLPVVGTATTISVHPGLHLCQISSQIDNDDFSISVKGNGVYTILVMIDSMKSKCLTFTTTLLEPSKTSAELLLIPAICWAFAASCEALAIFHFIYEEAPTAIRASSIGFYLLCTCFGPYFATPLERKVSTINFVLIYLVTVVFLIYVTLKRKRYEIS